MHHGFFSRRLFARLDPYLSQGFPDFWNGDGLSTGEWSLGAACVAQQGQWATGNEMT